MKTMINDRTLSYIRFNEDHIKKSELDAYVKAVKMCGADYIELGTAAAKLIDADDYSEQYILNVRSAYDLGFCAVMRFAYVTIPFSCAEWIEKVPDDQPVIIEAPVDEYSAIPILLYLRRFTFIRRVAAVRLTGIMGDSVEALVKWCRKNYFTPVDICPLNTMLTGASDAVAASEAGVPMLTLSFGRGYYYTSMEQYLIDLHINRRAVIKADVIKAICVASLLFTDIFGMLPAGLAGIIDGTADTMTAVFDVESGVMYRPYRALKRQKAEPHEGTVERRIKSLGLELEIETAIIDMLKKVDFSFYKEITKRNIID